MPDRVVAADFVVSRWIPLADPVSAGSVSLMVTPAGASAAFGATEEFAYVFLAPGTYPEATAVTVLNVERDARSTISIVEGGMDPVAVPGSVGDTLQFELQTVRGIERWRQVIPPRSPPVVVRTSPAGGQRDVPVALSPSIMFSEPMDSSVLGPDHIFLLENGVPVPGETSFTDGSRLRAIFTPSRLLSPGREYHLVLAGGHDLDGDPLASGNSFWFKTVGLVDSVAYTLRGTVTDSSSAGVSASAGTWVNAWVQLLSGFGYHYWWFASGATITDSAGSYAFPGIPQGARVHVEVSKAGYRQQCASPIVTVSSDSLRVDARLVSSDVISATAPSQAPGHRSISGVVRGASGSPIAGTPVFADILGGDGVVVASTVTDDLGRYLLCGLLVDQAVTVGAEGFRGVDVPPGGDATNVDLVP